MKKFDYKKARNICSRKTVIEAYGGLVEDWSWTAGCIYKNGKFDKKGIGYDNSIWATPAIIYTTVDNQEHTEDCYIDDGHEASEEKKNFGRTVALMTSGLSTLFRELLDQYSEGD